MCHELTYYICFTVTFEKTPVLCLCLSTCVCTISCITQGPVPRLCCSVLQCVAVCCSVLQCVAVCCSVLQCVAVCCSASAQYLVSQKDPFHISVAVCCSALQCVAVRCSVLQCVAVCCSVLQCVAVCCSVTAQHLASQRDHVSVYLYVFVQYFASKRHPFHFPVYLRVPKQYVASHPVSILGTRFCRGFSESCCSVMQCVAVCCSVHSLLHRIFWKMLQCNAVCCSVLQYALASAEDFLKVVAVCCSVLQCVAVCCSVLQCVLQRVAAGCSVLQ